MRRSLAAMLIIGDDVCFDLLLNCLFDLGEGRANAISLGIGFVIMDVGCVGCVWRCRDVSVIDGSRPQLQPSPWSCFPCSSRDVVPSAKKVPTCALMVPTFWFAPTVFVLFPDFFPKIQEIDYLINSQMNYCCTEILLITLLIIRLFSAVLNIYLFTVKQFTGLYV